MKKSFRMAISLDNPVVKNHIVMGRAVLPGMAYVDMLLGLAKQALGVDPARTEIRKLSIFNSLDVSESEPARIKITFTKPDQPGANVWNTRVEREEKGRQGADDALLAFAELHETNRCRGRKIDIESIKRTVNAPLDIKGVYEKARERGLIHDGVMRPEGNAYVSPSGCFVEIAIRKDHMAEVPGVMYHPALLDGVAMASGLLLDDEKGSLSLPTYYGSISCSAPLTERCFAQLSVTKHSNTHVLDMSLFDMDGTEVALIEGITVVPLRQGEVTRSATNSGMLKSSHLGGKKKSEKATGGIRAKIKSALVSIFAKYLNRPAEAIDVNTGFFDLGMESAQLLFVLKDMEDAFGLTLSPTILFENSILSDLIDAIDSFDVVGDKNPEGRMHDVEAALKPGEERKVEEPRPGEIRTNALDIAIIGVSGRYPDAKDVFEFWSNLRDGKDCIREIPGDRWDWKEYFSENRKNHGHHFSKWGGFIDEVDKFDPLFFNISPREAELLDPQDRLFLEHSWLALEDAGYTKAALHKVCSKEASHRVGVFAGAMFQEYPLFAAEASLSGNRIGIDSSSSSISARVSYYWDLNGPSMTIDTACSSSLTAIYQACQALRGGDVDMAMAGGVNLTLHPNKYLMLSDAQFISAAGHCASFGQGGDGYIPGEGVGVVVLKRLKDAERDNDQIYAVIKGAAINHGGRAGGYTVPNPKAQQWVIEEAIAQSGFSPETISYVEAHGTGTSLGDPIEVSGLTKAFKPNEEKQYCWLGSVKSNIGHCEAAAGVAGLTKVLLQMRHKAIVPSLHSASLNPHIDFANTPFAVSQEFREWKRPVIGGKEFPRRAGISSFGAGGSNAHFVLEEYEGSIASPVTDVASDSQVIFVVSARDQARLVKQAGLLLEFIRNSPHAERRFEDIAYTLQIGREALESRVAIVAGSLADLKDKLEHFVAGRRDLDGVFCGETRLEVSIKGNDDKLQKAADEGLARRLHASIAKFWARGANVNWNELYGSKTPKKVSLPSEPFAREHCWIPVGAESFANSSKTGAVCEVIHPLLHKNVSDLSSQRYSTRLTGGEFFLRDHVVHGRRLLPAVAFLEMAHQAVKNSSASELQQECGVLLKDVVFMRPLVLGDSAAEVNIAVYPEDTGGTSFEIYSASADEKDAVVFCQGKAVVVRSCQSDSSNNHIDISSIIGRLKQGYLDSERLYDAYASSGIRYGASHKGVVSMYAGEREVLAKLQLPSLVSATLSDYAIHPSLIDSALHSSIGMQLLNGLDGERPALPFTVDSVEVIAPCRESMWAWVRRLTVQRESASQGALNRYDVDVFDEDGYVCIRIKGSTTRQTGNVFAGEQVTKDEQATGVITLKPVWRPEGNRQGEVVLAQNHHLVERQVFFCGMGASLTSAIERLLEDKAVFPFHELQEIDSATGPNDFAKSFESFATALFTHVQQTLRARRDPTGKTLLQMVVPNAGQGQLWGSLAGLLKTSGLENPNFIWQVIAVDQDEDPVGIASRIDQCALRLVNLEIRYEGNRSFVRGYEEVSRVDRAGPGSEYFIPWKEGGVYLLSGGAGGLGRIFAEEIAARLNRGVVILTGRSALSVESEAFLRRIEKPELRVVYRQVDVCDRNGFSELVNNIREVYGAINGIIHSAGILRDNFILKKPTKEFQQVISPKVSGVVSIDEATRELGELDFIVLFSSVSGAIGKIGQADYSTANAFLDAYAEYRNGLRENGARAGLTLSINWPLWNAGGMGMDAANENALREQMGMYAMDKTAGISAFYRALGHGISRVMVIEGNLDRLSGYFCKCEPETSPVARSEQSEIQQRGELPSNDAQLEDNTNTLLKQTLSRVIKLPVGRIRSDDALEKYGIDSVMVMQLTTELESLFGPLSKTLFFEYQNLGEVGKYLLSAHRQTLIKLFRRDSDGTRDVEERKSGSRPFAEGSYGVRRKRNRFFSSNNAFSPESYENTPLEIAIVGLSGRYPKAKNLADFWENLRSGEDCIVEVPQERWDWREYFSEDRTEAGRHYSKWGGFIDDVDKFDPLFFGISPREAVHMDPQERLFLEHAWMALEDAGYTRDALRSEGDQTLSGQAGVYAGVMFGHYQLFGAEQSLRGNPMQVGGSYSSIANRVSYFMNLHGPSMAVDTMCSSSLTAIHLACQDLRLGRINIALAGGVNVTIHPNKYLGLSAGQFISSRGRCESFGEGGEGYVPGEGVGVVILKRLADAERDKDHIYGVIQGSAVNHGGKTNGYSVPNPNAQHDVISRALKQSGIDARSISYVEAHGTGTKLGDPIEVTGLRKAFSSTQERQFCWLGSAKSNIGHCESAAGVAGLTKVLLQLKHRELVPSLHSKALNPNIDFGETPFIVNQELRSWDRPTVGGMERSRVAAVSAFGAGGSNAHLVVEEYRGNTERHTFSDDMGVSPVAFILSARNQERLMEYAVKLHSHVIAMDNEAPKAELTDLAYTLQIGREPMQERLGIIANSYQELAEKLKAFIDGQDNVENLFVGQPKRNGESIAVFADDDELIEVVEKWIGRRKYSKLLELWVRGLPVDWSKLYLGTRPRRISAPTYPFARERYWVESGESHTRHSTVGEIKKRAAVLHPLIHTNTSGFGSLRFSSRFSRSDFQTRNQNVTIVPALAYIEMARGAICLSSGLNEKRLKVTMEGIRWSSPLVLGAQPVDVEIALSQEGNGSVAFDIYATSSGESEERVCFQGYGGFGIFDSRPSIDIARAMTRLCEGSVTALSAIRFEGEIPFDPVSQGLEEIHLGGNEVLAKWRLPSSQDGASQEYTLYPLFFEAAIQTVLRASACGNKERHQPSMLDRLEVYAPCKGNVWTLATITERPASEDAPRKIVLSVDFYDDEGALNAKLVGLEMEPEEIDDNLSLRPVERREKFLQRKWQLAPMLESASPAHGVEERILILASDNTAPIATSLMRRAFVNALVVNPHREDTSPSSVELWNEFAGCVDLVGCDDSAEESLKWIEWVQRLIENRSERGLKLLGVTQSLEAFKNESVNLAGASRAGLYRMLQSEYANVKSRHIDLDRDVDHDKLVNLIVTEFFSDAGESEVCYREGKRYCSILEEWQVPPGSSRFSIDFAPGEAGGHEVLLITGGTGGLGLQCAKHFVKTHGVRKLVLTGTHAFPPQEQWGRDEFGNDSLAHKIREIRSLAALGAEVRVLSTELNDHQSVVRDLSEIERSFGSIAGVIHCAGTLDFKDPAFVRKSINGIERVFAPKVSGLKNLVSYFDGKPLRYFVLFSSVSAVANSLSAGQSDYAMANAFMDYLADARPNGCPLTSIQWPSWNETGMGAGEATSHAFERTGLLGITNVEGMAILDRILSARMGPVVLPAIVDERIWNPKALTTKSQGEVYRKSNPEGEATEKAKGTSHALLESVKEWLLTLLSDELRIDRRKLEVDVQFADYGVDSVLLTQVSRKIEAKLGERLDPSVVFQNSTVESLARWLARNHARLLAREFLISESELAHPPTSEPVEIRTNLISRRSLPRLSGSRRPNDINKGDIAVVGMAGRFPGADTLGEYWNLLSEGRSAIAPVPLSRFGYETSTCAGLISSITDFDPKFFLIAQEDARAMDPQALIVLEESLSAIYHAGYTLSDVKGSSIGVYLGARGQVMANGLDRARNPIRAVGQNYLATNISQFFDLRGPSLVVDTACSSALVGMNLGIKDLLNGEVQAALVGGVSVMANDFALNVFEKRNLLSRGSSFHIFDKRASGVILGEGAGMVLLKTVEQAKRDGDRIYAVVKALAINNDGRTAGPATPNVESQKNVMRAALKRSGKDPRDIAYLDVNGSGSEVTDLLELKAIESVYRPGSDVSLRLGSMKPNIGHPLCAEGIASFIKLVLMLHHRSWVPFLSGNQPMTHYDFSSSPFLFDRTNASWGDMHTVALNCFADGGTNAHAILDAWQEPAGYRAVRVPAVPPALNKQNVNRVVPVSANSVSGNQPIAAKKGNRWKKAEEMKP